RNVLYDPMFNIKIKSKFAQKNIYNQLVDLGLESLIEEVDITEQIPEINTIVKGRTFKEMAA
ncbi:MAG: hypothetical protein ACD_79C00972G0001, partial [uncultured bacterium]